MAPDQDCMQCGRCCEKWGWDQKGVIEDILPWIEANRHDILQFVAITLVNGRRCNGGEIRIDDLPNVLRINYWIAPDGSVLHHCPFYRKAEDGKVYCNIHETKPRVCIGFTPWKEGIRDYALNCPACRNTAP
ncbi:MAG: YkgJ family cysteine cluster protein [Methanoregula sp.]|nr:YkgJ family cysteine cluster protein [Methanoregula sp.]